MNADTLDAAALTATVEGMPTTTDQQLLTYTDIAEAARVSRTTVARVMRGHATGVAARTRRQVLDAIADLGGDPDQVPEPGGHVGWPTYRHAPAPLTADQRRARAATWRANTRAKNRLLALAERAGWTVDDVTGWLTEHVDAPGPWEPATIIKLWSHDGFSEASEALTAAIAEDLPEGETITPRRVYHPTCRRCGRTFEAMANNRSHCPACEPVVTAEAVAVKARTPILRDCPECVLEGVDDPSYEISHGRDVYCSGHAGPGGHPLVTAQRKARND